MRTQKFVAGDLFVKNDCLSFDKAEALRLTGVATPLSAVCIVTAEPQLPRELELMDKACVEAAAPLLFDNERLSGNHKLWLFLAHGPWQANSVMVKHRKLWRSFPSAWELGDFQLCGEAMVQSRNGVRFAGVAGVSRQGLFTATQILRSTNSGALVLSERDYGESQADWMRLFDAAFPSADGVPREHVDWLSLSLACCPSNDIVIRVSGSWDEREASLDLIMLPEHLPRFDF